MFESFKKLGDRSAAGIVKAADEGGLPVGDVRYVMLISEARDLVAEGHGDWIFRGFRLGTYEPIWEDASQK